MLPVFAVAAAGASSERDSTAVAEAATPAGAAATAKDSGDTKPKTKQLGNQRNPTRRVETVHAGSYAGGLVFMHLLFGAYLQYPSCELFFFFPPGSLP